jgi:peptidoglycan/LPS O-acetylase OafA/YrhL
VSATAQEAPREHVSPAVAPPPGNPRFELFDSLRAIALLGILVFHVSTLTGDLNKRVLGDVLGVLGNQALVIFFIVSGFLLWRPYVAAHQAGRSRPSTRNYARRRILRILPAYWVALTVLAIYPAITGAFSHDWWRYYSFLQVYSANAVGNAIPVAWTLGVEVSFYVLLPVFALAVRSIARAWPQRSWLASEVAMVAAFASLGIGIQLAKSRLAVSTVVVTTVLGESLWLALGMALAVASVAVRAAGNRSAYARRIADHPGLCWLGSLACLLVAAAVLQPRGLNIARSLQTVQPLAKTLAGMALTAAVGVLLVLPAVFGAAEGGWPRRILAWRPLMLVGLVSYSAYLYHLTIAELVALPSDSSHFSASGLGLVAHVHHLTTPVVLVVTLAITLAVATVSYRLVELPFLRRKERRRAR